MDKLKQKQSQKVSVTVNLAGTKLRRKTKRRVRAVQNRQLTSLDNTYQQPLVRMIRYDVPAPASQPVNVTTNNSGIAQPPVVGPNKLIVDTPLEIRDNTPATEDNLAAAAPKKKPAEPAAFRFDPGPTIKLNKDGSPRKPRGPNKPKVIATVVEQGPRFEGMEDIANMVTRQRTKVEKYGKWVNWEFRKN